MLKIRKRYIRDRKGRKAAVMLNVNTYNRIEQVLEDYALGQLIKENKKDDIMTLAEAEVMYEKMKKAD